MATLAQSMGASQPDFWFWEFLKEELAPYPGRMATVGRMTLAATVVMLICEVFRIPYAFLAAVYTLLISRESPQATMRSAGTILTSLGAAAAYLLIGASLVSGSPWLHFLWNIATFFLAFFAITTLTNYVAALIFAVITAVGIPLWDSHAPVETHIELTLWIVLAAALGASVSVAIELLFARTRPGDAIVLPITQRLAAARSVLLSFVEGGVPDSAIRKNILRLRAVGTSKVQRLLRRSAHSRPFRLQMSAVAELADRLVDTAATLTQIPLEASSAIRARARDAATAIGSIDDDLTHRRIPEAVQFTASAEGNVAASLLGEMEDTITFLPEAFAGARTIDEYLDSAGDRPQPKRVAGDDLFNPDHLKFALRGCLAAGGAYVVYKAIDWPGISSAIIVCVLTALSTIGASRQNQILRFFGALLGGVFAMGTQIFLLPNLASVVEFAVVFAAITFFSAWVMTSSARLSYVGFQAVLVFYLVHLQEFAPQTSLAVSRDRVMGILFGLLMMWLTFDRLSATTAAMEMKTAFISGLRLLGQLTREPVSSDTRAAIEHSYMLSETLNAQMDKAISAADGVLFEFGPVRAQNLALRDRILRWQPALRTLFLMRRASLRYVLRLPGFQLPEAGLRVLREYNEHSARMLDDMADRLEGRERERTPEPEGEEFVQQVLTACGCEARELPPQTRSFLILLRRIDAVTRSLAEKVRAA